MSTLTDGDEWITAREAIALLPHGQLLFAAMPTLNWSGRAPNY
jgi:hypothetical protein